MAQIGAEPPVPSSAVSELHAQGILRLRRGKIIDAISCFHQGLKLLSRTGSAVSIGDELNSPSSVRERSQREETSAYPLRNRILYSVDLSEEKTQSQHDDIFVQFKRALYLLPDSASTLGDDYLLNHTMSGVLMYNIGLALHIQALETCRSDMLPNALHFYAMAHHTFTELSREHVNLAETLNLALLAIVNNIAHINVYLRDFGDALIFCNELSMRFSYMISATERGVPELLCDDYDVFVANVCFCADMGQYPAPAA